VQQRRMEELRATYRSLQTKYRDLHAQFTTFRQGYCLIACAWCQRRIRWVPKEPSVPGEISHGICLPCAARVLTQLYARAEVIPSRRLGGKRGRSDTRIQLPKHLRKTVKANTMADLPSRRPSRALKAHGLLAPSADNPDIALAGEGLARVREPHVSQGDARTGVADQLATALDLDTANRERW